MKNKHFVRLNEVQVSGAAFPSSREEGMMPCAAQHPILHLQVHCVISDGIKGWRAELQSTGRCLGRLWRRSGTAPGNGSPKSQLGKGGPLSLSLWVLMFLWQCSAPAAGGHFKRVSWNPRDSRRKGLRPSSLISLAAELVPGGWLPWSVEEK